MWASQNEAMQRSRTDGYILVLALAAMVVTGLMVGTLVMASLSSLRVTGDERSRVQAFYAAQSGLERITRQLTDRSTSLTSADANAAANLLLTPSSFSGDVGTGTFTVEVSKKNATSTTAVLTLKATGQSQGAAATRILSNDVQILVQNGNTGMFSPSALVTTGNVKDNGAAPIAGEAVTAPLTRSFTCSISATTATPAGSSPCKATTGGLNTYTLTTAAPAPKAGESYSDANGNQYIVQRATTDAGVSTVTLVARNENPAAAASTTTGYLNAQLQSSATVSLTQQNISAIMSPRGSDLFNPSNNTGNVCSNNRCTPYDFPPAALFQMIFGTTKADFKLRMEQRETLYEPSANPPKPVDCSAKVMWVIARSFSNSCATSATNPKVIVIDASQATNGTVQIQTGTTFYGVIYVISGTTVSLAGSGTYVGSVIAEAGIDPTPSANDQSSVTGNGSADCPTVNGAPAQGNNKPAKLCYRSSIAQLTDTQMQDAFRRYSVTRLPSSWAEYSQ